MEFHPSLYQKDLLDFCTKNGIVLTAYSPLGRGEDLQLQAIQEIAAKLNKTPAQIILKWMVQKGIVVVPKATSPERIAENLALDDWEIYDEDMQKIDALNTNNRIINPVFADF